MKGMNFARLNEYWRELHPINNITKSGFNDMNVKIIYSEADLFVPSHGIPKLVAKIQKNGGIVELEKTGLGHMQTVVNYIFIKNPGI